MTEEDFAFFEDKYPGWEGYYGDFWKAYREMADPRKGHLALELFPAMPPICRVCQMPCVFPRPDANEVRLSIDTAGQRHAFCSEACQHIFRQAPERHCGMTWWEVNDGVELSRYIEDGGLLRSDGRTLMGQPHVHTDERWLWTIDDIRRTGIVIQDPLKTLPAEAFTEI
jgi:hypothetical protein